jgi:NADH dehydrogenase
MDGSHRVVIVGGGFGGLYAARRLKRAPVQVVLVDRRNFHLFQPLLYQVATGWLSAANIAAALRAVLSAQKNARVILGEAVGLDPERRQLFLSDGELSYDTLVVATGSRHHYFGNPGWKRFAPGLKTVEDATEIRRRIFRAFEAAEREPDPEKRRRWLTFVIVGGGPTGVELAGALGEIARDTCEHDFRNLRAAEVRILLIEGTDRILPPYSPALSAKAEEFLRRLGVAVLPNSMVTDVQPGAVVVKRGDISQRIESETIIWAAGVQASRFGRVVAEATGAQTDRSGRIVVNPDLTLPGHPEIFVIGDLAHYAHQTGKPLPGMAPVAMQQGSYVAKLIRRRLEGKSLGPFRYRDRGYMAIVGRAAAVARIGSVELSGLPAWILWLFVHLIYLVEFRNRLLVLIQWAWYYFTRNRAARLITGEGTLPLFGSEKEPAESRASGRGG